jgi:hypothetical protein
MPTSLPLGLITNPPPQKWSDYYAAILKCDRLRQSDYPVFVSGKTAVSGQNILMSWIDTITAGMTVIANTTDWTQLSEENISILFGYKSEKRDWGLLGAMTRATKARSAFNENRGRIRERIHEALTSVYGTSNVGDFREAAIAALKVITKEPDFGSGIATRLIALTKPEFGVSVNAGSAVNLAELSGTSRSLGSPRNYLRLLDWIYKQPWFSSPQPHNTKERLVWQMRAALLDAFVYQPPPP